MNYVKALINAVAKEFPTASRYDCYFHFKQTCLRKIQNLGLSEWYLVDSNRNILLYPQSLAFIPPVDVLNTFKVLKAEMLEFSDLPKGVSEFYGYFECTFIGTEKKRGRGVKNYYNF